MVDANSNVSIKKYSKLPRRSKGHDSPMPMHCRAFSRAGDVVVHCDLDDIPPVGLQKWTRKFAVYGEETLFYGNMLDDSWEFRRGTLVLERTKAVWCYRCPLYRPVVLPYDPGFRHVLGI
jgi:hypothetical protein